MKKYLVVVEEAGKGYSAFSPDLPGCIATGATREEVERRERFFVAFAHSILSTNAYKYAGAQYFGPIVGNTSTTVFLDCLREWRTGVSLQSAPLIALANDDKAASDRSRH